MKFTKVQRIEFLLGEIQQILQSMKDDETEHPPVYSQRTAEAFQAARAGYRSQRLAAGHTVEPNKAPVQIARQEAVMQRRKIYRNSAYDVSTYGRLISRLAVMIFPIANGMRAKAGRNVGTTPAAEVNVSRLVIISRW